MAITDKPGCAKQHQDVQKVSFPSGKGRMDLNSRQGLQAPFVSADFHELLWSPMITATELMTTEDLAQGLQLKCSENSN